MYVDGFVFVVPKKNIKAYKKMADDGGKVWKKFGSIHYFECMGDDLKGHPGTLPFPKLTKQKPGEITFFSFIVFRSKAHRNSVNKKVMAFFAKKYSDAKMEDMPFDSKRMAYGGFKSIVNL